MTTIAGEAGDERTDSETSTLSDLDSATEISDTTDGATTIGTAHTTEIMHGAITHGEIITIGTILTTVTTTLDTTHIAHLEATPLLQTSTLEARTIIMVEEIITQELTTDLEMDPQVTLLREFLQDQMMLEQHQILELLLQQQEAK